MNQIFTLQEVNALEEVIKEYLTELRAEIADTDDHNFKEELKEKEERLRGILVKLAPIKVAALN